MADPINMLLLVEDDDNDVIITKRKIAKSSVQVNVLRVTHTLQETKEVLTHEVVDVVLLDLNLPDSRGLDTLDGVRAVYDGIVIVLTSIDDEQTGINAIRKGADEYLIKTHLNEERLSSAINFAIERRKMWQRVGKVQATIEQMKTLLNK